MSNLLNNLRTYAGKWELDGCDFLDAEDKAMFRYAKVVDSDYGKSVCLFLQSGGYNYIPVSQNSKEVSVGDEVNLDNLQIESLHRNEADGTVKHILRAKIVEKVTV